MHAAEVAELDVAERVSGAMLAAAEDESVSATVKWFRADKGYGFLDMNDDRGDVFLHAKVLRGWRGQESIAAGATMRVVLEEGPRGRQVARVLDVDMSTSSDPNAFARVAPRAAGSRRGYDLDAAVEVTGKVKWFDDVRGFGFVAGDDFGRDVFVHCSILRRTHVASLVQGQSVTMRVVDNPKGREAVEITIAADG